MTASSSSRGVLECAKDIIAPRNVLATSHFEAFSKTHNENPNSGNLGEALARADSWLEVLSEMPQELATGAGISRAFYAKR